VTYYSGKAKIKEENFGLEKFIYRINLLIIYETIGDVKHHIPIDAFKVPIRIVLLEQLAGKVIPIKCKIFGKNLIEPLNEVLTIKTISTIRST